MATLRLPFGSLFGRQKASPKVTESRRAREFAKKAYNQTGGVTPDLKRVYDAFLDNERRRNSGKKP
ncbi:hypothetical protein XFLAVUS301_31300 [Xanthobacter flavus]|uniref:Uncharacterized protein n=1 Tax=Xanthobacter flavus TaxID=281 RepID=A0A9W6CJ83_XANFL|nr:hypothetical protein XFLAVUS301_31300 [Xanthobacter flavus]